MKTAIVTITIGDLYNEVAKLTHPTIKRYADKIGADFIVWNDKKDHVFPHYLKLEIGGLLKTYDRVIYIDTDIIIREDAPNLFDVVPETHIGMHDEGRFIPERGPNMVKYLTSFQIDPKSWDGKYYNTGVMVFSKAHQLLFMRPQEEGDNFYEQTYINMMLCLLKGKVFDLSYKFNRMHCMDLKTGETRLDSYFIHYAGFNAAMPKEHFLGMIAQDIQAWEEAKKTNYFFPRNVSIVVEGGLGDQICAEPVIRKMRDHIYKNGNIVVLTDFMELYSGYEGVQVLKKTNDNQNIPGFFKLNTMHSPEHESWKHMSHALCHGVDFASLQLLRGPLPSQDKTIQLRYEFHNVVKIADLCGGKLEDIVVLHPGRGWDSKTFPSEVWDSWIDALIKSGRRVALIGKRVSKEQGVVETTPREGCLNLIDQLDFKDTLALLAHAPVLISNDSAPIHMAGAFDNFIGVIATCKHPELILPYRHGSVWYKSKALEVKKMYEQFNNQPSQVDGATIDFVPDGDIRGYLPSAADVVAFVNDCFRIIEKSSTP